MHPFMNHRKAAIGASMGLSCLLGITAGTASGAAIEWKNPGTGNYSTATNWNPERVPNGAPDNDDARINNGGTAEYNDTRTVGSITLGATTGTSGTLRILGGELTTTNSDVRIGGAGNGAVAGNGTGRLEQSAGALTMNAGNVNVGFGAGGVGTYELSGGSLAVNSGFIIAVGNSGTGTVNQSGGSIFVRGPARVNPSLEAAVQLGRNATTAPASGSYTLSGGDLTVANVQLGRQVQTSGAQSTNTFTLTGAGVLRTGNIAFLNTAANNTFNFTGGTLTATNVNIPLVNNGGTLSPQTRRFGTTNTAGGDPAPTTAAGTLVSEVGQTTFSTNYTQSAGTLAIDIAGTGAAGAADGFDFVNVPGIANLTGTVAVNELNGFDPALGSTFDVLTAQDIIGTLVATGTTPGGNFYLASVESGGNGEVLRLTVVPEPAALGLLGMAGLGLLARRRRTA